MNRALPIAGTGVLRSTPVTYLGFSIDETSGAATAKVILYDNASAASGTILDVIDLLPGQSAREWYGDGLVTVNGIYCSVVSGAVAGSVRVGS